MPKDIKATGRTKQPMEIRKKADGSFRGLAQNLVNVTSPAWGGMPHKFIVPKRADADYGKVTWLNKQIKKQQKATAARAKKGKKSGHVVLVKGYLP